MTDSAIMIARDTHSCVVGKCKHLLHARGELIGWLTIQPREPFVDDDTGPGAHPLCFASGDKIAQPVIIPRFIETVVGNPMMMPVGVSSAYTMHVRIKTKHTLSNI